MQKQFHPKGEKATKVNPLYVCVQLAAKTPRLNVFIAHIYSSVSKSIGHNLNIWRLSLLEEICFVKTHPSALDLYVLPADFVAQSPQLLLCYRSEILSLLFLVSPLAMVTFLILMKSHWH